MTRNLGPSTSSATIPPEADAPTPAWRIRAPGWRDPRLWLGVAVVAASVLLGGRLLAAADDTVPVWSIGTDVGAGEPVGRAELEVTRVRFADGQSLAAYHHQDSPPDPDLVLRHPLSGGELLPRSAVGPAEGSGLLHLPLAVDPELIPPSVATGSLVDVYLTGPTGEQDEGAELALGEVTVVAAPAISESFGSSGRRQLVVAVAEEDAASYFRLLGAYDAPAPIVVKRG